MKKTNITCNCEVIEEIFLSLQNELRLHKIVTKRSTLRLQRRANKGERFSRFDENVFFSDCRLSLQLAILEERLIKLKSRYN